ncbi:MAG: NrfD/PsrC family molybdoenzyme membrane anchor subunit [Tepidisphaeraceae bacterium]
MMHEVRDNRAAPPPGKPPVLGSGHTFGTVTDKISAIVLSRKPGPGWIFGFAITFVLVMVLLTSICYLLAKGIGIWGNNIPVAWAFDIINFVWWIGIGHAGTFISAFLLLLRQDWRTSINRFAEAMTLFAVACAGLYPLLHLGRPWKLWWLFPYPDTMQLWPQFRSPLVWDVFAVSTYATVSLLFWYVGLIPDLATLRDRSKWRLPKYVYGFFSMGWRGSARHWHRYQMAYLLLAGLAAPLVISVHSIVGMDFAGGLVPGWHSTIFPPYFVAGAIFSGFAMVLTLAIPLRYFYGLEDMVTIRHIDNCAKLMLVTGLIVAYGYGIEIFMAWYSGNEFEQFMMHNRMFGPYATAFWLLILCNVLTPQLLWFKSIRQSVKWMFVLSLVVNVGMWLERFVIIVVSLHRDFLPSAWKMYYPTFWDFSMFFGSIGLFLCLFLLFIRLLPVISIFEMRELVEKTSEESREAPAGAEAHPA